MAAQDVDVRPQRRQRGAQLVPGVLDEGLLAARERRSASSIVAKLRAESACLVGSAPAGTSTSRRAAPGDPFRGGGQRHDRAGHAPGDQPARGHGQHRDGQAEQREAYPQRPQDVVDLVQVAGQLHGAPPGQADRDDALVVAGGVGDRRPTVRRPAAIHRPRPAERSTRSTRTPSRAVEALDVGAGQVRRVARGRAPGRRPARR